MKFEYRKNELRIAVPDMSYKSDLETAIIHLIKRLAGAEADRYLAITQELTSEELKDSL